MPTYVGEIDALADFKLPEIFAAFDCRNNRLADMALYPDDFAVAPSQPHRHATARDGSVCSCGTSTSGCCRPNWPTGHATRLRAFAAGVRLPADTERCSLAGLCAPAAWDRRPSFVVSCACASTAKTFGNAARMIEAGLCDAAIVGGADTLCLTTLYGFHALALNAPGPCRPFDAARDGISIGEAAGFALLEKPQSDAGCDAIMLLGVGESNDAHHMSSPHPDGIGARLAMERALTAAGRATGHRLHQSAWYGRPE